MKIHITITFLLFILVIYTSNGCIFDNEKVPSIGTDTKNINFGTLSTSISRAFMVWNDGAGDSKLRYTVEIYSGSTYFSVSPREDTSNGSNDKNIHIVTVNYITIPEGKTKTGEIKIYSSKANDSPYSISLSASRMIEKTCNELIDSGWEEFENGNYSLAMDNFTKATSKCSSKAEAYTGKGWCELKLSQIGNSILSFNSALNKQPSSDQKNDIYAGLSFAYDAQDSHDECLSATINVSSSWEFAHDYNLDYNDIILLRAINYYAKGDFINSLQEIRRLEPGFNVNLTTIEGKANLAVKIEELNKS